MFKIEPIDGWGFHEAVDGRLAGRFDAEVTEAKFKFAPGVIGWKARALNGKYAGCFIEVTPRHVEWTEVVVVSICRDEAGADCLFSGMANTEGLDCDWK